MFGIGKKDKDDSRMGKMLVNTITSMVGKEQIEGFAKQGIDALTDALNKKLNEVQLEPNETQATYIIISVNDEPIALLATLKIEDDMPQIARLISKTALRELIEPWMNVDLILKTLNSEKAN